MPSGIMPVAPPVITRHRPAAAGSCERELFHQVYAPLTAQPGVHQHRLVLARVHRARLGQRARDIHFISAAAQHPADHRSHHFSVVDDQDPQRHFCPLLLTSQFHWHRWP